MNRAREDLINAQIDEQVSKVVQQLDDELKGVYNVRKQFEIYFKYTAIIIEALPKETVNTITDALKEHGQMEFCRIKVDPIHAVLHQKLSDAQLDLFEFDSEHYESPLHQMQCEASSQPWFDPDNDMWMNRFSDEKEFALRQQFKDAGRLDDYLDGEREFIPETSNA